MDGGSKTTVAGNSVLGVDAGLRPPAPRVKPQSAARPATDTGKKPYGVSRLPAGQADAEAFLVDLSVDIE